MSKRNLNYLELYNQFGQTGQLSHMGIEASVKAHVSDSAYKILESVMPTFLEAEKHALNEENQVYWDAEPFDQYADDGAQYLYFDFGPLRETLLLICAALNEEFKEDEQPKVQVEPVKDAVPQMVAA